MSREVLRQYVQNIVHLHILVVLERGERREEHVPQFGDELSQLVVGCVYASQNVLLKEHRQSRDLCQNSGEIVQYAIASFCPAMTIHYNMLMNETLARGSSNALMAPQQDSHAVQPRPDIQMVHVRVSCSSSGIGRRTASIIMGRESERTAMLSRHCCRDDCTACLRDVGDSCFSMMRAHTPHARTQNQYSDKISCYGK